MIWTEIIITRIIIEAEDYESNDKTTDSLLRRRVGEDTEQLVQALPRGTPGDGHDAQHGGAVAPHRGMAGREVLYRHRLIFPRNVLENRKYCLSLQR